MVEGSVELVYSVRPERISAVGTVEGNPNCALVDGAVVGQVRKIEPLHWAPAACIKDL